jgi:hypothetical protein
MIDAPARIDDAQLTELNLSMLAPPAGDDR